MAKSKANNTTTPAYVWTIAVILALLLGVWFLSPYLGTIVLGLLLAYIFWPMHSWLLKYVKKPGIAATLTTFISFLIVIIPLTVILILAVDQALNLVDQLEANEISISDEGLGDIANDLTANFNDIVETTVGVEELVNESDVQSFLSETLPKVASYFANLVIGIVGGLPAFFTLLIIYLFVFVSALLGGKNLRKLFEQLSPFDDRTNKLYIERIGAMSNAMVRGQMIIALAQGLLSAVALALVGLEEFFLIFAILFTVLSFIPLGAGIITIPLGILLLLTGNIWGGFIVLFNHFVIVTNIDNYLRPKVIPKNAQMPAVLVILSAFAGVAAFGFIGVVYGPVIMIFITTTIELYLEQKEKNNAAV